MHIQIPTGYQPIPTGDYVVMEMECRPQSILQGGIYIHEVQGGPTTARMTARWQIGSMAVAGPHSIGSHANPTPMVWQDVYASESAVGNLVVDADWPHRILDHSATRPFSTPRDCVRHLRTPVLQYVRLLIRVDLVGGTSPAVLTTVSLHQLFATS